MGSLRVAKVTGGAASKLSKIRVVRKSIARVYIVMHQKQKENLRKLYRVSLVNTSNMSILVHAPKIHLRSPKILSYCSTTLLVVHRRWMSHKHAKLVTFLEGTIFSGFSWRFLEAFKLLEELSVVLWLSMFLWNILKSLDAFVAVPCSWNRLDFPRGQYQLSLKTHYSDIPYDNYVLSPDS